MADDSAPNVTPVQPEDMPLVAGILMVLDQIEKLRNPFPGAWTCKTCRHKLGWDGGRPNFPNCVKGYKPCALNDGCDDWEPWGAGCR
jgi:hypothetical protein